MVVRVRVNTPTSTKRVTTTTNSKTQTSTRIEGLAGVDVTDAQDGETLVYNAASGNWEAAPLTSADVQVNSIDGGTF